MLVPSIFSNNFVDDIFDDVFPFGAYNVPAADNRAAMNTDVKEFDDRYELEFELPGFKKEDIQAELKNTDLGEYVSQVLIPTEKTFIPRK